MDTMDADFALPRELPFREIPDLTGYDEDFNEIRKLIHAVVS
jgi:hypothetical protein